MSSNRDLFRFLVKEKNCSLQKRDCDKNCSVCPFFTEEYLSTNYFHVLLEILRSRDPELYLVDELQELESALEGGTINEDPDNKSS